MPSARKAHLLIDGLLEIEEALIYFCEEDLGWIQNVRLGEGSCFARHCSNVRREKIHSFLKLELKIEVVKSNLLIVGTRVSPYLDLEHPAELVNNAMISDVNAWRRFAVLLPSEYCIDTFIYR